LVNGCEQSRHVKGRDASRRRIELTSEHFSKDQGVTKTTSCGEKSRTHLSLRLATFVLSEGGDWTGGKRPDIEKTA